MAGSTADTPRGSLWRRAGARFVTWAILIYLGFGAFLYGAQRSMMYLPVAENPADDIAVEMLHSDGERLKLWVVSPGNTNAVIYFGGNAEDVYANAAEFRAVLPDTTVYLVNYRGYGGSTGRPSEAGLFADALAIFDAYRPRHQRMAAVGRSLGSGVAVYLASQRELDRLALITPHDSALAIAQAMYPIYPLRWMMHDQYESVAYAGKVQTQTLIITAGRDRILPARHAQRLHAAFPPGVARIQVIADAGHNDLSYFAAYWRQLGDFLSDG